MSFLNGFISNAIDEKGNSDVMRINYPHHKDMIYSMDSEHVTDLNIIQGRKIIKANPQVVGGKTLIKFKVKPESWYGMTYRRIGFVKSDKGIWDYSDHWSLPRDTFFMVMLPTYSVIRYINIEGLKGSIYEIDNRPILAQIESGENLDIHIQFSVDSEEYTVSRPQVLQELSFPTGRNPQLLDVFRESSIDIREGLAILGTTIDWIAKGATIIKALQILGFL